MKRGEDLKIRTKNFALRTIRMTESLARNRTCDVISRQLIRSGTSVGANYRAACRAKSKADFIHKLAIVEEEADESIFWMELLVEAGAADSRQMSDLLREGRELLAIMVASIRTVRKAVRS